MEGELSFQLNLLSPIESTSCLPLFLEGAGQQRVFIGGFWVQRGDRIQCSAAKEDWLKVFVDGELAIYFTPYFDSKGLVVQALLSEVKINHDSIRVEVK